MKRFGLILRQVRETLGMSQGEMADALSVSRGYISMLESRNESKASWELIERFCTFVGISHNQIVLELLEPDEMSQESKELLEALRQSLESENTIAS